MPYYSVVEGEGIAGPQAVVSAETTTLLSCIGIVMRNNGTNFAGLYHYGAETIAEALTQNTILQMLNDINPTDIFVTAPAVSTGFMPGSSQADRDAVDDFLQNHAPAGANIQWMPDRVFSNYRMVAGAFTVNHAHDVGSGSRRVIEMATQMPGHVGRQINANTTFYGGVGPNAPTHDHTVDDSVLG